MKRLLKGGRVVDPANGRDGIFDILIDGDRIARVGKDLPVDGATVIEVPAGFVVTPGLFDMHVHLREPGQEHKETVATGTASAVAGGFTAVACMPNTTPINDNAGVTEYILQKAAQANLARVYPIGAVSKGSNGDQLADIAELRAAGCVGISDDGRPVKTALLMRRALEYAGMFNMPVLEHCEDPSLKGEGVAHEGYHASTLGLRGIPGVAESIMVQRDIALAEMTGAAVHICHMSAATSLRAVREGKQHGARVTCEVAPHHFTLTDESLSTPVSYDTNMKMNPPLRAAADRDEMLQGIVDGSVDAIATDHAPHHYDEKKMEFDLAPFGIVGLETCVSICFDRLVHPGLIRLPRLVELLSTQPRPHPQRPGGDAQRRRSRRRVDAGAGPCGHDRSVDVPIESAQHAVCRMAVQRRRGGDDRRRPHGLCERQHAARRRIGFSSVARRNGSTRSTRRSTASIRPPIPSSSCAASTIPQTARSLDSAPRRSRSAASRACCSRSSGCLSVMGRSPSAYVRSFEPRRQARDLKPIVHRWTKGDDLTALVIILQRMLQKGSIEAFFLEGYDAAAPICRRRSNRSRRARCRRICGLRTATGRRVLASRISSRGRRAAARASG